LTYLSGGKANCDSGKRVQLQIPSDALADSHDHHVMIEPDTHIHGDSITC
jgi:hypothetical protein